MFKFHQRHLVECSVQEFYHNVCFEFDIVRSVRSNLADLSTNLNNSTVVLVEPVFVRERCTHI